MIDPDKLVDDWFELLAFTQSEDIDRKVFKTRHDAYAKTWARLPYEVQGYVCEQISTVLQMPRNAPDGDS